MNRLTRRERLLVIVLVALIILTIGYYLLTPQVTKYIQISKEIDQINQRCNQLKIVNEELKVEQSKFLRTQYQLQELKGQFNKEMRDGSLYVKLDTGARANNVTITEIIPQKIIYSDAFLHLPITISLNGDYINILAYMQWLENMNEWANLSRITQFVIKPAGQEFPNNSNGQVICMLTLSLYSNTTPEGRLQIESLANRPVGKINAFIPEW